MDTLLQDVRYSLRRIRGSRTFSTIVIATLALGIGANTAIFSIVDAILLRPLPYDAPDRLITIQHFYPSLNNLQAPVSAPGFRDYRDKTTSFTGVAVQSRWIPNLTGMGEPERLVGSRVSALYFSTLGVHAVRGREPGADEDQQGQNRVVVISDGLWHRVFNGSLDAMSKTLTLDGQSFQVIGVMPPEFKDFNNRLAQFWTPLVLQSSDFVDNARTNEYLALTARLKPGVTVESAQLAMTAFAKRLVADYPTNYPPDWTLRVTSLNEIATGRIRPALFVLLGAVGLVLLIACANVANLLLARGATRSREVAIRTALGARSGDLVRQMLTESVLLSLCGGVAGLVLAYGGVRGLTVLFAANLPRGDEIGVDGGVMLFALVISIVTGVVFGLMPAIQAASADVHDVLKESGRSSTAGRAGLLVRRSLVVVEVALALMLLAGAGLLIRSFAKLQGVDPGFDPRGVVTMRLALPAAKYPSDTQRVAFWDRLLPGVAALSGVTTAGLTSVLPFGGDWSTASFQIDGYTPGKNEPGPWGDIRIVSPGFLKAIGAPLTQGRFFEDRDRPGSQAVAVIDEEFVRRYFKDEHPIGKRITFSSRGGQARTFIEIVGVVGHTMHEGLDASPRVQLYLPYTQVPAAAMALVVRVSGRAPASYVPAVRGVIRSLDADLPIAQISTMDDLLSASVGQRRLSVVLLSLFAGIALTLASVGIYGVMSYAVTQRAHELGIRMALGAARGRVVAMVMRQGAILVAAGVLLGVAGALALTRVVKAQLYSVTPTDPTTFVVVTVLLSLIAIIATLVPALRATRVDPVVVLRQE
jgi:putative ABC transport system permease protein